MQIDRGISDLQLIIRTKDRSVWVKLVKFHFYFCPWILQRISGPRSGAALRSAPACTVGHILEAVDASLIRAMFFQFARAPARAGRLQPAHAGAERSAAPDSDLSDW